MKITKLLTSITLAAVCTFVFDTNAFSAGVTEITLYQNASDTDNTVNAEIEAWYGEIPSTDDYGNPLTAPTRTGYVFTGYYDARHGGTQYYYPDMTSDKFFTGQSMLALYAHWIPITIASNESNPTCDNDTVGATSGDTALDAVWNANTLNLKFMANGQEFASNTCTYGQNITIPTTEPTRTGYNFAGWAVHEETVTYVGCSSIPDETTCGLYSNYGCHWYNNTCFGAGDPYSISNQEWCEAEGFYWCTEDRGGTMEPFCEYENDPC